MYFTFSFSFFFFKQKTAYEMRISDWSSDVCSSDLASEHSKLCSGTRPNNPAARGAARLQRIGLTGATTPARSAFRKVFWSRYEDRCAPRLQYQTDDGRRSEEHTSELQSLMRISYAVFCLKKKNKNIHIHPKY